jgi:DNA primase
MASISRDGRTVGPLDSNAPAIIITEAAIDALSLAMAGCPALAFIGTSGPRWLHIACGLRRVVLAFDADEAGDKAAAKIAALLQPYGATCERLRPDGAKDWNAMLQVLGSDGLADWLAARLDMITVTASTCSTLSRVALADPTPDQIGAMDATSEADALELVQRLEADGVRFLLNATPGVWRFDGAEKLCIEYERIARADWHDVMKLRADIARLIAERRDAPTELTQNDGQGEIENVYSMP